MLQWMSETMPNRTGRSSYSKMLVTTSSMLRCTSSVVGERPGDSDLAGAAWRDALRDQLASVDQEAGADAFAEAVFFQVADLLAEPGEVDRHVSREHAGFVRDDFGFLLARRVVELDGDEALAGRMLEVLERALVARVVGDDEQEAIGRFDHLAELLDGQQAAVVGERVDEDGGVLASLDDFVEVADRADLHRARQRAIDPAGAIGIEQVAADEVAGGEVFVAGDGDERHAVLACSPVVLETFIIGRPSR